jgi:hypothetical protein
MICVPRDSAVNLSMNVSFRSSIRALTFDLNSLAPACELQLLDTETAQSPS